MKKTILLFLTILFLISTSVVSANEVNHPSVKQNEVSIQPRSGSCTLAFEKTSSTKAQAQTMAGRPGASSITSIIQLQKKSGSSYVDTSSKSTKTVQTTTINHIKTFSISPAYSYRIKVGIKYTKNGITTTDYYYKVLK